MVLDSKGQVWTFVNWGRPFRLDTPMLDCSLPETTPIQAESGWSFCSVLTQSGDVLVFWPFSGEVGRRFDDQDAAMDERGDCHARATNNCIPCVPCALRVGPLRLPHIPRLPELDNTGISQEEKSKRTILIKIAAYDNHLIGLTNKGHVLKYDDLADENSFNGSIPWQYVRLSHVLVMPKLTCSVVGEF
jgi:SCF-associated factor 1